MNAVEKIKFIWEERAHDLNEWQKEFVGDLYEFAQDDDELTPRQIQKVNGYGWRWGTR